MNNNNYFTPGPWNSRYNEETGTEEVWSDEGLIAEVNWTRCRPPEVPGARVNEEANARLIAAAPELLEVAQKALGCIGEFDRMWKREIREKLKNVIAKAKGLKK